MGTQKWPKQIAYAVVFQIIGAIRATQLARRLRVKARQCAHTSRCNPAVPHSTKHSKPNSGGTFSWNDVQAVPSTSARYVSKSLQSPTLQVWPQCEEGEICSIVRGKQGLVQLFLQIPLVCKAILNTHFNVYFAGSRKTTKTNGIPNVEIKCWCVPCRKIASSSVEPNPIQLFAFNFCVFCSLDMSGPIHELWLQLPRV